MCDGKVLHHMQLYMHVNMIVRLHVAIVMHWCYQTFILAQFLVFKYPNIGVAHGPAGPALAGPLLSSNDSTKLTRSLDDVVKFTFASLARQIPRTLARVVSSGGITYLRTYRQTSRDVCDAPASCKQSSWVNPWPI